MTIRYKILFCIVLQHDFFTEGKCAGVQVLPSPATSQLLKDRKLKWRQIGNRLIVLVETDANGKPMLAIDASDIFRFYLAAPAGFFNYTNLPYVPSASNRFYFSNLDVNKVNTDLYISKSINVYNNSENYLPGDMAASPAGDIHETLKKNNSAAPQSLDKINFWRKKSKLQCVTAKDKIKCSGANLPVMLNAPSTDITVSIFKINPLTGTYSQKVTEDKVLKFKNPVSEITADLQKINEGTVRVNINGQSEIIYTDNNVFHSGIFGVAELFSHLASDHEYSFFDAEGKIKEVHYIIRFSSRSVLWKYITKTNEITAIKDSDNIFQFESSAPRQFISVQPIPLAQKPYQNFLLESSRLGQVKSLRNAAGTGLKQVKKDGDNYLCSEIFLNY